MMQKWPEVLAHCVKARDGKAQLREHVGGSITHVATAPMTRLEATTVVDFVSTAANKADSAKASRNQRLQCAFYCMTILNVIGLGGALFVALVVYVLSLIGDDELRQSSAEDADIRRERASVR
jgi:hypothetical protein